jgi:hypothetical protein
MVGPPFNGEQSANAWHGVRIKWKEREEKKEKIVQHGT